jgi:hypothetical protein
MIEALVVIVEAFVYESPLFEVMTEDGPAARYNFQIGAILEGGQEISLTGVTFDHRCEAARLVAKINERGSVNMAHWYEGTSWSGYDLMWTPEEEKEHAYFYEYA